MLYTQNKELLKIQTYNYYLVKKNLILDILEDTILKEIEKKECKLWLFIKKKKERKRGYEIA